MNKNSGNEISSDKNLCIQILKKNPNNYEALLKLGLIDIKENNYSYAKDKFNKLIRINKKKYEAHLNLSNLFFLEGDIVKANNILKNYINNIEENIEIINSLAINFLNSNDFKNLEAHIAKYINSHESHILCYLKGFILLQDDKIYESESFFKKSMKINNGFWNNYDFLLKQYEKQSRLEDFKNLVKTAKKIFKNNIMISYYESLYLFRKKNYKDALDILINKENKKTFLSSLSNSNLSDYLHLLSRVYEKLGFYDESYKLALNRNKTVLNFNENKSFKKEIILETITTYKNFFKKNKSTSKQIFDGIDHSNLTFIIGFPRSGTTLLDTILRSHSKTMVLEEEPYLLDIRHNYYKNHQLSDILNISEDEKIQMQKKYINSFEYKADKIIIDKYPLNLIELGFIKTIFPKSKIVLAIRHPLDCIISCVMTSFKMNEAMVNFEDEKTTAHFYNECFDLLFRYVKFYKIDYLEIKYENVISNFKNEINNLLKYLNLDFEESINNFHKTAMLREKINTPSYDQVTQPIYSSSINRYKNFTEIKNIKDKVNYWIKTFSY